MLADLTKIAVTFAALILAARTAMSALSELAD
jgi:hypothetical protein